MTAKRITPRGIGILLDDLVREIVCLRDTGGLVVAPPLARAVERAELALTRAQAEQQQVGLHCDFCGKNQRETKKLIAGPTVYICDDCAGLCHDIITEDIEKAAPAAPSPKSAADAVGNGRPFAELSPTGLLWLINRVVFHPRGMMLAVHCDDDGKATGWSLRGDGARVIGFSPADDDESFAHLNAFLAGRGQQ